MRNSRATNYHSHNLSELQKSLLKKEPSLAPTPSDINWYEVRRDFDKFVNQLRYRVTHFTEIASKQENPDNINVISN